MISVDGQDLKSSAQLRKFISGSYEKPEYLSSCRFNFKSESIPEINPKFYMEEVQTICSIHGVQIKFSQTICSQRIEEKSGKTSDSSSFTIGDFKGVFIFCYSKEK